jgi:purine nucleoside phosphorylase
MTVHPMIGGIGLAQLEGLDIRRSLALDTPYGVPSAENQFGPHLGDVAQIAPWRGCWQADVAGAGKPAPAAV